MENQEVSIELKRYEELILVEQKYKQYKNFLLNNTSNNLITKTMSTIEGKNLYELLKENQEEA